jgi:1-acyl-sn-glycerol-3-phosphate acyltransferase
VALVAIRAGVPVVPAAITGTFHALAARRWHIPRRVPIRVRFGRALRFTAPGRRPVTQGVREDVTARIMAEIAALLGDGGSVPASASVP